MKRLDPIIRNAVSPIIPAHFFSPAEFPTIPVPKNPASLEEIAEALSIEQSDVERHIGQGSTFAHKVALHTLLTQLCAILPDQSFSESRKVAIKAKVAEGAGSCTPGFMNRVSDCLEGFIQPTTLEQLMAMYRRDLVGKAAFGLDDDQSVHTQKRVFEVANLMGLEIPQIDAHPDVYRGALSDSEIKNRLARVFETEFTPSCIVERLFYSSFAGWGYAGRKEAGDDYSQDIQPGQLCRSGIADSENLSRFRQCQELFHRF
jgi:hypothetical protein